MLSLSPEVSSGVRAEISRSARGTGLMVSRAANWLMVVGAVGAFIGLCVLPSALGAHQDGNLLSVAALLLSLGALSVSAGFYVKARSSQKDVRSGKPEPPRKIRGGCDLCKNEPPVIQCKVHQLHLCATCLTGHYDVRSCVYVPSLRRPATKNGKNTFAKAQSV